MFAPYDIPNGQIDGYDVVVNKPKRRFLPRTGRHTGVFAGGTGDRRAGGKAGDRPARVPTAQRAPERDIRRWMVPAPATIGAVEVLEAALAHPHYTAPLGGPHRGRGVAHGLLGQLGGAIQRHDQRERRRHRHPDDGVGGSYGHAYQHRDAGRRDARAAPGQGEAPRSAIPTRSVMPTSAPAAAPPFATAIAAVEAARDV